jgi:hypothetical protein
LAFCEGFGLRFEVVEKANVALKVLLIDQFGELETKDSMRIDPLPPWVVVRGFCMYGRRKTTNRLCDPLHEAIPLLEDYSLELHFVHTICRTERDGAPVLQLNSHCPQLTQRSKWCRMRRSSPKRSTSSAPAGQSLAQSPQPLQESRSRAICPRYASGKRSGPYGKETVADLFNDVLSK